MYVMTSSKKSPSKSITKLGGLADLAQVAQAIKQNAKAQEEERLARAQAERQFAAEANLFRDAVGHVEPVKAATRLAPLATKTKQAAPIVTQASPQTPVVMTEALSDEFDPEHYFELDGELPFRRPGIGEDVLRKLRKGAWPVEAVIDLHGMRREEAREALAVFIQQTLRRGVRCIRVVHGKGLSSPDKVPVLKGKVRSWLTQKEEVLAFVEAREGDGGSGALLVLLQGS